MVDVEESVTECGVLDVKVETSDSDVDDILTEARVDCCEVDVANEVSVGCDCTFFVLGVMAVG